MAAPQCMSDDGNNAVFVGTMLETGDAVALCNECLVGWSAALLSVMTGIDPGPFIAAISEGDVEAPDGSGSLAAGESSAAPAAPDPPPQTGKRGRTSTASPDHGTDAAPSEGAAPAETDPAASDA